jgi:sporulation protein YlmC with PRC-barrel domain
MMSACSRAHVVAAGRPLSTRAQSPRARSTRRVARASPCRGSDVARRSASASALEGDAPAAQMPRDPVPELSNTSAPYEDAYVTLTRGQLVRKDVVTRTGGTRLGNVSQLWVDTDEWEVIALDCRPVANGVLSPVVNAVGGGAVDHVLMSSLRQVGDVVLVHDENAVERRWSSYGLSTIVGCDVVTERGTYIGRVRDFEFDPEDGLVQRLIVDALGLPVVPEEVVSTYAIDVSEILSSGADRIIVAEGAEARVEQLSSSLLQRLQLAAPPWEDDLADYGDYYARDYARDYEAFESEVARERRRDARYDARYDAFERDAFRSRAETESARRPARDDAFSSRGVRLVRPNEPFERRDADGGYGDRPQPRQRQQQRERDYARPFDEWVVEEQRQYEYETEGAIENREGYAAGRKSVASPPPPPPEAWGRAAPPPRDARARWDQSGGSGTNKGFDASEDML